MSLTSRTNRWASRVIIILQLITWNAVGIVLLHRGVGTLRRRILETSDVVESDPRADLESVITSMRRDEYDLSAQQRLIDKNVKIVIRTDPDRSSSRDDRNLSVLSATRSDRLKDAFEAVSSEEQRSTLFLADPLAAPTAVGGAPSSRLKNRLTAQTDRRTDDPRSEDKDVTNRFSRTARDREHILEISRGIHAKEDVAPIPNRLRNGEKEDLDFARNASTRAREGTLGEKEEADQERLTAWTERNDARFSRVNENSATMAVVLVSVGVIMLLVGPIVIVLRIFDERRQARKPIALPVSTREDLPPTYEQAVLMDEAPRYSTLALNYDRTPPPTPTLSGRRDVVAP